MPTLGVNGERQVTTVAAPSSNGGDASAAFRQHSEVDGGRPDIRPSSAPPSRQHRLSGSFDDRQRSQTPSVVEPDIHDGMDDSSSPSVFKRGLQQDKRPRRASFRELAKAGTTALMRIKRRNTNIARADEPTSAHPPEESERQRSRSLAVWGSNGSPRLSLSSTSSSQLQPPQQSPYANGTARLSPSPGPVRSPGSVSDYSASETTSVGSESVSSRRIPQAPGLVGIANHGNTCFMNAVVQCLSNTEALCRYFTLDSYKLARSKRRASRTPAMLANDGGTAAGAEAVAAQPGAVTDQFALLLKAMWSQKYEQGVSLRFRQAVGASCERYHGQTQQDAQEFLLWLLNTLDGDLRGNRRVGSMLMRRPSLRRPRQDKFSQPDRKVFDSYIQNLFSGMAVSTLKCQCGAMSQSPDPFLCLSLPLPGKLGVRKLLVNVVFRSVAKRPVQLGLLIPRVGEGDDVVSSILQDIAAKTNINVTQLILCSIKSSSFGSYHLPYESVDVLGQNVYVFEAPTYAPSSTSLISIHPSISISRLTSSATTDLGTPLSRNESTADSSSVFEEVTVPPAYLAVVNEESSVPTSPSDKSPHMQEADGSAATAPAVAEPQYVNSPPGSLDSSGQHRRTLSHADATVSPGDGRHGDSSGDVRGFQAARSASDSDAATVTPSYVNVAVATSNRSSSSDSSSSSGNDLTHRHRATHRIHTDDSSSSGIGLAAAGHSRDSFREHGCSGGSSTAESLTSPVLAVDGAQSAEQTTTARNEHASQNELAERSHDSGRFAVLASSNNSALSSSSDNRNSMEVDGAVGEEGTGSDHDSAIGSLCEPTTPGQATAYINVGNGNGNNSADGGGNNRSSSPGRGPPTLPRGAISLRSGSNAASETGDATTVAADVEKSQSSSGGHEHVGVVEDSYVNVMSSGSESRQPGAERGSEQRPSSLDSNNAFLPAANRTLPPPLPSSVATATGEGSGNEVGGGMTENSHYGNRTGMIENPHYGLPVRTVSRDDTVLLIVMLVQGDARTGIRFGSPMILRVFRTMKYKHLHYLIVKSMQRYLGRPVARSSHSLGMFRIRVQGGPPGNSYLNPDDTQPLYSETIETAISSVPLDYPEKHVRIITEWTPEGRSTLCMLAEEIPDVDRTVRQVEDSLRKEEKCTLNDCLSTFLQEEQLLGDSAWNCPRCDTKRNGSIKHLTITALPKILVVHIKRFQQVGKKNMKAHTFVDFPVDLLDMEAFSSVPKLPPASANASPAPPTRPSRPRRLSRPGKVLSTDKPSSLTHAIRYVNIEAIETNSGVASTKYKLIGTVNHLGSLNRGHYQATCRSILTNHWYMYDDSKVVPIAQGDVVSPNAFMLFYQRLDLLQPVAPFDWIKQINTADLQQGRRQFGGSRDNMGSALANNVDSPLKRTSTGRLSSPRIRLGRSPHHSVTPSLDRSSSMMIPEFADALDVIAAQVPDAAAAPGSETSSQSGHKHHNALHTETAL